MAQTERFRRFRPQGRVRVSTAVLRAGSQASSVLSSVFWKKPFNRLTGQPSIDSSVTTRVPSPVGSRRQTWMARVPMALPVHATRRDGSTMLRVEVMLPGPDFHVNVEPGSSGPFSSAAVMSGCQLGHESMSVWTAHTASGGAAITISLRATAGASWLISMSLLTMNDQLRRAAIEDPPRKVGKLDRTDAVAAARAALSGTASVTAKSCSGPMEQMRVLLVARRSARQQRGALGKRAGQHPRTSDRPHRKRPRSGNMLGYGAIGLTTRVAVADLSQPLSLALNH